MYYKTVGLFVFPLGCLIIFFLGGNNLQAQVSTNRIIAFNKVGSKIEFAPPQDSISFMLQSQSRSGGPWSTLLTLPANPTQTLVSMTIPAQARNRVLRVIATVYVVGGQRRSLAFSLAPNGKSLSFRTIHQARMYSVERYQATAKTWVRISTAAASPVAGRTVKVNLPANLGKIPAKALRVVGVSGEAPPASDFSCPVPRHLLFGPKKFPVRPQVPSPAPSEKFDLARAAGTTVNDANTSPIEESDIWKIRGRKIYLFNQYRGLQVIDASDSSQPLISGFWPLPAVGEDMFLLGDSEQAASGALLLARLPANSVNPEGTRVLRLSLDNDTPQLEASLDLPGTLVESRMVGSRLHLISTSMLDMEGNWSPAAWIITLDLSQPGILVEEARQSVAGSVSTAGSTQKYLWLAGSAPGNWSSHILTAFPIETGGVLGTPRSTPLGGVIQDKFKVGDAAGGLAAVVQSWVGPDGKWQNRTLVETYADEGMGEMRRRSQLEIIRDEWLFATRFDQQRLYVVTFRQTDPLWLVDLSDPDAPAITGHLEVPGWSSFIEPMGDLLVAVGREGGQVQVSLFDVSDSARPRLASRVNVGESGYSWSEAEWNEKAVKILPAAGLILVPVTEWAGGTISHGVRVVGLDLSGKNLTAQGTIQHSFSPRRSALLDGELVASVSNRELFLVDVSDRANPSLQAEVTLAFGVDRLAIRSGYLYQFENRPVRSGKETQAILRVAPVGTPDQVVAEIPLAGSEVLAAEVIGGRLVVVEGAEPNSMALWRRGPVAQNFISSSVSVWALTDPALPSLLGRVSLPGSELGSVEILEISPTMVAVTQTRNPWNNWRWGGPGLRIDGILSTGARLGCGGDFPGASEGSLSVDLIRLTDLPGLLGSWKLEGTGIHSISKVEVFGDLLVCGFAKKESIAPWESLGADSFPDGDLLPVGYLRPWPRLAWQSRFWLQVVDLADPNQPLSWAPVEIPGALVGVSWLERGGGVLFARAGTGSDRVCALGFDGESASMAAEVDVGSNRALLSKANSLFVAGTDGVHRWEFSENSATFSPALTWALPGPGPVELKFSENNLYTRVNNEIYQLTPDQTISVGNPPYLPEFDSLRASENTVAIPTGIYGTFLAEPRQP